MSAQTRVSGRAEKARLLQVLGLIAVSRLGPARPGGSPKKSDAIECFFASIPLRDTLLSRNERIQNLVRAISCRFDSGPGHHQAKILPATAGSFLSTAQFPKFNKSSLLGIREPLSSVNDPNSFVIRFGLIRPGDKNSRISVLDFQQWGELSFSGMGIRNIVRYLNIGFTTIPYGHKIDFTFIKNSDVNFIAASGKFDGNSIFQHSSLIEVSRS